MQQRLFELSFRQPNNGEDHHLWNNNGTWWFHATRILSGNRRQRVRHNLKTRDVLVARQERDRILRMAGISASRRPVPQPTSQASVTPHIQTTTMSHPVIPFLSAERPAPVSINNYRPFTHTRSYIIQCSSLFPHRTKPTEAAERELAVACGYSPNNLEKFRKRREGWDACGSWVPYAYLQAIGVETDTLKARLEADMSDYESVSHCELPAPPIFMVRYNPCFYRNVPIPETVHTETEAAAFAIDWMKDKKSLQAILDRSPIRRWWCGRSMETGEVEAQRIDLVPNCQWAKKELVFSSCGRDSLGITRIG